MRSVLLVLALCVAVTCRADYPVVDRQNLMQSKITAAEAIEHTRLQTEQLRRQLAMLEQMLRNTRNAEKFTWDEAHRVLVLLEQIEQQYETISTQPGQRVADNYRDLKQARSEPRTVQQARRAYTRQNQDQMNAYRNSLDSIRVQRRALAEEAEVLQGLVKTAQTAEGRMQALQAGNQLASQQIGQLQKMRRTLLTLQELFTQEWIAKSAREAEQRAARERMLEEVSAIDTKDGPGVW